METEKKKKEEKTRIKNCSVFMYAKTTTRQDVQNEDDEAVRVFGGFFILSEYERTANRSE